MNPKIKNAIIFIIIGGALFASYYFFIKAKPEEANLTTSSGEPIDANSTSPDGVDALPTADSEIAKELLVVLLNVKNITLDDAILSDPAFKNLVDSTVTLIPDKNEGRPNPFAPIGSDGGVSAPNPLITPPPVIVSELEVPAITPETIPPATPAPATN